MNSVMWRKHSESRSPLTVKCMTYRCANWHSIRRLLYAGSSGKLRLYHSTLIRICAGWYWYEPARNRLEGMRLACDNPCSQCFASRGYRQTWWFVPHSACLRENWKKTCFVVWGNVKANYVVFCKLNLQDLLEYLFRYSYRHVVSFIVMKSVV